MVVVSLLHMSQTYIYGAYKGRRELLWFSGCALFVLVLAMAFTGYLLPWDQRAYFATAVGTNAASEVPLLGESLKRLMRGGTEMGTLTISRFFVAHVFLIPARIFALVASHIFLFRKAGPVDEDPIAPKQAVELFYPRQVLMDLSTDRCTGIVLLFRAHGPRTSSKSCRCAICSASRMVLPADFSVA
jgi:ubiquinol-cytochrome c reductase cytochrome b subunit